MPLSPSDIRHLDVRAIGLSEAKTSGVFARHHRRLRRRSSSNAWKSTHRDANQSLRRDQPRRIRTHVEFMRGAPIEGRLEQRGLSQPKRRPSPANFHFGTSDKFGGRDFRARAHPNNR